MVRGRGLILKLGFQRYPLIGNCPNILRQPITFFDADQTAAYAVPQKRQRSASLKDACDVA